MGLITEMFLTFEGFAKPNIGDHLRISCVFKGLVRDTYTVLIAQVCDCDDEPETVLLRIENNLPVLSVPVQDHSNDCNTVTYRASTFFQCNTVH